MMSAFCRPAIRERKKVSSMGLLSLKPSSWSKSSLKIVKCTGSEFTNVPSMSNNIPDSCCRLDGVTNGEKDFEATIRLRSKSKSIITDSRSRKI